MGGFRLAFWGEVGSIFGGLRVFRCLEYWDVGVGVLRRAREEDKT